MIDTKHVVSNLYRTTPFNRLYGLLVTSALSREPVTYQYLAQAIGAPVVGNNMSQYMGKILRDIAVYNVLRGEPILSSMVVRKQSNVPGPGYYAMLIELGASTSEEIELARSKGIEAETIWQKQLDCVFDYWK